MKIAISTCLFTKWNVNIDTRHPAKIRLKLNKFLIFSPESILTEFIVKFHSKNILPCNYFYFSLIACLNLDDKYINCSAG